MRRQTRFKERSSISFLFVHKIEWSVEKNVILRRKSALTAEKVDYWVRVARWFIFNRNPPVLVRFGSRLNGNFWYLLGPFGALCVHLLYFKAIRHMLWQFVNIIPILVYILHQEKSGNPGCDPSPFLKVYLRSSKLSIKTVTTTSRGQCYHFCRLSPIFCEKMAILLKINVMIYPWFTCVCMYVFLHKWLFNNYNRVY
jgi:hypothetical protein